MDNIFTIILLILFTCSQAQRHDQTDFTQYVNPFIGSDKMGHTFPGACVPFGMVQLSPDTDTIGYWDEENERYNKTVYEYCAGYQYDDPTIFGFSHTHFSGTGHSDLGDFLIMPTRGKLQLNPGHGQIFPVRQSMKLIHQGTAADISLMPGYINDGRTGKNDL